MKMNVVSKIQSITARVSVWFVCAVLLSTFGMIAGCGGSADSEKQETVEAKKTENVETEVVVPWGYRPYDVKIWVVVDANPRWTPQVLDTLYQQVSTYLYSAEPSAWKISISAAPQPWSHSLVLHADSAVNSELSRDDMTPELYEQVQGADKLFLVRMNDNQAILEFQVNEIDISGWSLGPTYKQTLSDRQSLAAVVGKTLATAFRPIAMIDHTEDTLAILKTRAFGLMSRAQEVESGVYEMVPDKSSPCWIQAGELFEPVVRKSNRQRKFDLDGIETLDSTLLVQQGESDGPNVTCKVVSAKTSATALGRRFGKRTERLGIVVRNEPGVTRLKLTTKRGTDRFNLEEVPLNGYEIYSFSIYGSEDSMEYLGKTDWTGSIDIQPGKEGVRLLLIKSGERRLARMPVAPGYKREMEILLPDDEARIFAEGVVSGLKTEILDLISRREVLIEQTKIALERNDLKSAEITFGLYQDLMNLAEWNDYLAGQQRRLATNDNRQQVKIDKMFDELQSFASEKIKVSSDKEIQEKMLAARKKVQP